MYIIGSHIITPLGEGVECNYQAVLKGLTTIKRHEDSSLLSEPFQAALFEQELSHNERYTRLEQLCIDCAEVALQQCGIDPSKRTVFILSTTKGNIELLQPKYEIEAISPAYSGKRIAEYFGNQATPIVVSNACTSGVCAQITAMRLLQTGMFDYAVVIGVDLLSAFIISGFNSLKALSDEPCRPYDKDRKGLNLGEAVACMVVSRKPVSGCVSMISGNICNDANHISGPSRTGEGSMRVLKSVVKNFDTDNIAVINAHGTSTLYNDEMESIAIERAGLADIPVNSLKSIFGHTLGAAGILESLLTIRALKDGIILPTRNFNQSGVSRAIKVSNEIRTTDKKAFIKLMSGFGGCNAAILYSLEQPASIQPQQSINIKTIAHQTLNSETDNLETTYREQVDNYPKFFKMDKLSRAGFVATELIAKKAEIHEDCAVVIFTSTGSLANDLNYQRTINDFPSPALFVYTLPNIVTGEIAIRHHLQTETSCYLLPSEDWNLMQQIVESTAVANNCSQVLYGWLEAYDDHYYAKMKLVVRS